jgi:hypothetical protein
LAGSVAAIALPVGAVRWMRNPAQEMRVAFLPDSNFATVSFRHHYVDGMLTWLLVVGAAFSAGAVLAWWAGRHSIRFERRSRLVAALRDLAIAGGVAAFFWYAIVTEMQELFLGHDLVLECPLSARTCRFPSSVQFDDVAGYLSSRVVAVPLIAGRLSRAIRPPRRRPDAR